MQKYKMTSSVSKVNLNVSKIESFPSGPEAEIWDKFCELSKPKNLRLAFFEKSKRTNGRTIFVLQN